MVGIDSWLLKSETAKMKGSRHQDLIEVGENAGLPVVQIG